MRISAVIITYNEAARLARCLQSLENIVEEVVIVDSGSTDATEAVAKQYPNVKFFSRKWEGYSKTKNWANQQAEYEWILSIDADEVLSETLRRSIQNLKSCSPAPDKVYAFNRLTHYCGQWIRYAGWYPDTKVRLFPKGYAHWEGDFVHEKLHFTLPVAFLEGDLLHYSYETLSQHRSKTLKYARLYAEQLLHQNRKVYFGTEYLSPIWTFIKMYGLKLGFLEGIRGLQLCWISAWGNYQKYKLYKQMRKMHGQAPEV